MKHFEKFPAIILEEIMISDRNRRPEVFYKNLFLEISQNSQEGTCARVFFLNKVEVL